MHTATIGLQAKILIWHSAEKRISKAFVFLIFLFIIFSSYICQTQKHALIVTRGI